MPRATDARALTAGMQRIPVKDGTLPAYVALPQGGYKKPVVIVGGLRLAKHFAAHGGARHELTSPFTLM